MLKKSKWKLVKKRRDLSLLGLINLGLNILTLIVLTYITYKTLNVGSIRIQEPYNSTGVVWTYNICYYLAVLVLGTFSGLFINTRFDY